jgi:hypothetical protein
VSYSVTISALVEPALRTVMPCCWTCCGRRGTACCTRFCTCTWAVSGSVPGSKLTVMLDWPFELLLACMYRKPSSADSSCSMTWVIVFSTTSPLAPG